jgi:hypothetical protein
MLAELADAEEKMEQLYGKIFDLQASLGCLVALMQEDIDGGKIRCTTVRAALMADARLLAKG